MKKCTHLGQIKNIKPINEVCADCTALGEDWVHLRQCRTCGYVGCCDESKNKHAQKHFHETKHPIIKSLEPGENWSWCYIDETYLETHHPSELPVNDKSKPVIRNYLIIAGIYTLSTSIIWGVNTLFLLDAGLDIMGVFIANAVFTGSMALFEIPTGVIADTRGRRASFLLSVSVMFIGTIGYVETAALGGSLLLFCVMSGVLGLAYTFYSGAVEAWLVDALKESGYSGLLDKVFARGSMVSGSAMIIGSIAGGLLGSIDLSIPFLVRSGLLAAVYIIAYFTMHDMGFTVRTANIKEMPAEMKKIAFDSITFGWKEKSVKILIIASFFQAVFMAWGFYAWPPYFLDLLGKNLTWVAGVIAALVALATIIGNSFVEWITRFCGKRTTIMLWAAGIQTVAIIGVGFAANFWIAVGLYLIAMVTMGVLRPVRQAMIHENIPSEQRASVISFDSLVSSGGSMFGQVGLARITQIHSFSAGYIAGGIITVLTLPALALLRRLNNKADVIIGKAGQHGPCAGQGLPEVSAVDADTQAAFDN